MRIFSDDEEVESNIDSNESSSSSDTDSSEIDSDIDPNEPVYCICNKPYNNR